MVIFTILSVTGNGFTGTYICQNIKLYTLNIYKLIEDNSTKIKAQKKKKKRNRHANFHCKRMCKNLPDTFLKIISKCKNYHRIF